MTHLNEHHEAGAVPSADPWAAAITCARLAVSFALAWIAMMEQTARAEVQTFTDLASWQAAVADVTFLEDFEGATVDDYFGLAGNATTSPNGFLGLSANANFGDNAVVDVSPYVSSGADINGDVVVNMRFLDAGHGANAQETVTVSLPPGVEAFAFEYNNYDSAGDGAFLSFEGTNGQIVGSFDSTVNGFFGVLDTDPNAVISSFSFTGDPTVGTGFSAFNSFDDVRYSDFDALKLRVNTATGAVEIFNDSPTDFQFDSYRIVSSTDDLNYAEWSSFSNQGLDAVDGLDGDSTVGNGIGETWDEAGGASDSALSEAFLLGSSLFDEGRTESLGLAFKPGGDTESLTFEYRRTSDGVVAKGLIEVVSVSLPGDYNTNGVVDAADFTVWRDQLGMNATLANENPAALTPGVVDQEDYDFWVSQFGETLETAAVGVPEPAAIGLAIALFAAVAGRRCQQRRR
ncbi:hypothetical protein Mal64_06780 [Pseudobythopirellula maris]|uniref:PEP-CTERM protein-sorting domain-containing protein n=1 Tax=Pseudobythopirellula maris TaxID=2527991 RepID=A0A5C5ZVN5_9BACT|nr:hypothetical protein [Pseudobythopirellula maris]TWT90293.1 hypothetical protein Mal64_06780 [Pseudobythopirellula maris]